MTATKTVLKRKKSGWRKHVKSGQKLQFKRSEYAKAKEKAGFYDSRSDSRSDR